MPDYVFGRIGERPSGEGEFDLAVYTLMLLAHIWCSRQDQDLVATERPVTWLANASLGHSAGGELHFMFFTQLRSRAIQENLCRPSVDG